MNEINAICRHCEKPFSYIPTPGLKRKRKRFYCDECQPLRRDLTAVHRAKGIFLQKRRGRPLPYKINHRQGSAFDYPNTPEID